MPRIDSELLLKLGPRVSPRTVWKYMPRGLTLTRGPHGDQAWPTFANNHATAILAWAFGVVVAATSGMLYVLVVTEHRTRQILHCNVTAHPTVEWMLFEDVG
jgi:putative transposase